MSAFESPVANLPGQLSFHSFFYPLLQKIRWISIKAYQSTYLFKHYHVEVGGSAAAMISQFCV